MLAKFQRVVLPRAGALKKAVIHGDINEQNLLLHPDKPEVPPLPSHEDPIMGGLRCPVPREQAR